MGIRKKICLGFALLSFLLLFSALISYFELKRLRISSQGMLDASLENLRLSRGMLDAVQDQNTALLQILMHGNAHFAPQLMEARGRLDSLVAEARASSESAPLLDSVSAASQRYRMLFDDRLPEKEYADGNLQWFTEVYRDTYRNLMNTIENFLVSSQEKMDASAQQLQRTARRAIMPGVIALGIAIVIILVFFYFVDVYFIRPVVQMTRALKNYLAAKVPFHVKFEGRDEVSKLREYIETLIEQLKSKKNE